MGGESLLSRKCAVCQHPDRRDVDALLVEGGASIRGISRKFVLSEDSISRHKKNHLPKIAVEAATEAREYDHHAKLRLLEKTLWTLLKRRFNDEDDGTVLKVHASLLKNMEFELKLGELEEIRKDLEDLRQEIEHREIDSR